ncbi:MAG: TetR/AcrR family transcriptional regulator [Gemmatimonadales bacterium]
MGSIERRTRERAETRQRILEAAREMFVERGYEATTMRAIAARIEYTPTAIYHHFRNKEALLAELCALDFKALGAAFLRIERIEDPVERLRRCGRVYVEFGLKHPMQYQLMFMTRKPEGVVSELRNADPSEDAYAFLRATCAAAIATGRIRQEYENADELALMAWSALHGLLSLTIVKQGDDAVNLSDPKTTAVRICDALLEGVLRQHGR